MYKVLMACYGGGHVQSLIPVAKELSRDNNVALTVIGFTTARSAFLKEGILAQGYDSLLDYQQDEDWLKMAEEFLPDILHPDISRKESLAYFAIGLKNLVEQHGEQQAIVRMKSEGRKSFYPKGTFLHYLKHTNPDVVITSTSPRSELALQHAAIKLNIRSIAVSDLFLQHESSYICRQPYASKITVISDYVKKFLEKKGLSKNTDIHITGNPAFDLLANLPVKNTNNTSEQDCKIITWICPSGAISQIGKAFLSTQNIVTYLESFCVKNKGYKYMIREHPSLPLDLPVMRHGKICPKISVEDCLQMSDVILMEVSTVGLQAALMGIPVITINANEYPPYASLGISVDVKNLNDVGAAILDAKKPSILGFGYPDLGGATKEIVKIIMEECEK